MYVRGTEAYKYEQNKRQDHDELLRQQKLSQYYKNKARSKKVARAVIINIAFMFIMCFCILLRFSQITNLSKNNAVLSKQYEALVAENKKLQVDIQAFEDPKYIEDIAVNQYNMVKPSQDQIIYLDIGNDDYVSTPLIGTPKSAHSNVIIAFFYNVLSYFD